jgi:hypothetical protein
MSNAGGSGGSSGDRSLYSPNRLARSEATPSRSLEGVSLGLRRAFSMPASGGFEDLLTAIDEAWGRN